MQDRLGAVRLEDEYKEAAARLRTVRDLVRFGVSRFNEARLSYGHGTDNALDEAFYLVRHALHLAPAQAESFLDARLARSEVRAVVGLLQRRVRERLPAAYLTHEAWIGPHRFRVDARAIVPRSYIGHWLLGELSPWIEQPERVGQVLELCTGSGCLAVLAALALPHAHIDALDVSAEALEVARDNVGDYGLNERIELIQGDLFAPIKRRRYELIIANPPYVRSAVMSQLPPEYRHEPALALAGGDDGLDVVRRILAAARAHLRPHGLLVMEVGHARPAVEAAYPRTAFTWIELDGVDDAVFVLNRPQLPAARAGG
ncbi:MAG: 50S ribosomal protein L3 N(5)-glutamine methyltransferase [Betaproteobacteria bacterium]|nr:50S ribosomal protein L3 N(5)-glutamine methyltransferase [Betaproteobacteria bacterium]